MKKQKSAKRSFISSVLVLCLCFTMFVGTTYAWYNDSVTSGRNKIVSGSLEMVLEKYIGTDGDFSKTANWETVTDQTKIFNETAGALTFEPGAVQVAYVRVKNEGDLAFKYSLAAKVYEEKAGTNQAGVTYKLSDYLKFGQAQNVTAPFATREDAIGAIGTAGKISDTELVPTANLQKKTTSGVIALVIYLPSNTGNEANPKPNAKPEISFGLNALATQYTVESDSFSNNYDATAPLPEQIIATAPYTDAQDTVITAGPATATIPAATDLNVPDGTDLVLTVKPVDPASANITIAEGNGATAYDVSLMDTNGTAVTATSGGIKIELAIGVVDLQHFYHNDTELESVPILDALVLNKYYYDVTSGILTFITDSFSPFTAEYLFDGGLGTEAYPYLIASADQWNAIDSAEYFKLVSDIDFKGAAPEGYNGRSTTASTVILGDGHVIKNASGPLFSQNWLYNLIVKDFTIEDSTSDGSLLANAGAWSSNIGIEIYNVDVKNCTVKGGCFFLPWVYDNYDVSIKNCDVINSKIYDNGAQGFSGAFVGNSKATVVVDNCTLTDVTIEANKYACGGFIGSGSGTVKNSSINAGTTITQFNNGLTASAIGGGTVQNCEFYGTIKTEKIAKALFQGFDSTGVWSELTPSVSGSDFTIGTDGTITYNGTGSFSTVKVYQKVNIDRLFNGTPENGGYPYQIGEVTTFTNVSNGTAMTNAINYITAFKNVAPEYSSVLKNSVTSLPAGLSFSNSFAFDNGIAYLDASEGASSKRTDYVSGTYISNTATQTTVTVFFAIYDSSDTLISVASTTYKVNI